MNALGNGPSSYMTAEKVTRTLGGGLGRDEETRFQTGAWFRNKHNVCLDVTR